MSKCRYKSMGMGHCDSTPEQIPCFPCRERQGGTPRNTYRSPVSTWFEHLDRKMRAAAGVPSAVLTGTPSGSGPDWRREYMGEWTTAHAAMEAEEKRQHSETNPCSRCGQPTRKGGIHFCTALWQNSMDGSRHDSLVDALKYALSGYHRHGKSEAMRLAEERMKHFNRIADAEVRWLHEQGIPLADIEMVRQGSWLGDENSEAWLAYKPSQMKLVGFLMHAPDFAPLRYRDRVTAIVSPKPPTLREWLGDRVSELGPWADVLREQPVPAGHIEELLLNSSTGWLDYLARGEHGPERGSLTQHAVAAAIEPQDPFYEALQMALFTRHPAVKPEPKPAAFPWDPCPEVL